MAPIAITTSLTSPPGLPIKKSALATVEKDAGLNMDSDGSSTPYSSTSTAVSEFGDKFSPEATPIAGVKELVEEVITLEPAEPEYYSQLLASSLPVPSTKAGATVYGSAIQVLEAFAVKESESVWVYDDASQVGFGARALQFGNSKVNSVQTREGAGMELAGYTKQSNGRLSVFASTSTLPYLVDSLSSISGNVIINLASTAPGSNLEFTDSIAAPGVIESLNSLPEDWTVVFSSGSDIVNNTASIYGGEAKKVIHVVESTYAGRETTSFRFPSSQASQRDTFTVSNGGAAEILVAPASYLSTSIKSSLPAGTGLVELNTFSIDADSLFSALAAETRKTVTILGASKADAESLKALILSLLYSASGSSKAILPLVKTRVVSSASDVAPSSDGKVVSFYTTPTSSLPELMAHLFLSSPSVSTSLAQFGSATARGVKSVLSLTPSPRSTPLTVEERSDVAWISDANILKSTDVLSTLNDNGLLVLELPWAEEELPVKLSRSEIQTIKSKNIRVFLLDLDPTSALNPIREQVAFLLLYTGKQRLPFGVQKVLNAFHSGQLGRDEIEDAQAGLIEVFPSKWEVPELPEGKVEKAKAAWEWDALPGVAGLVSLDAEAKPSLSPSELAARHLLFREAFTVPSAKLTDPSPLPGISALRPSMSEETFLITVSENRRLTPMTYDRNVFHMEFDTTGTGFKYEIGEAIGIHGWNDTAEVLDFCQWYGLEPDALVTFPSPTVAGTLESRTVFQLLQQNIDLFGRPGKAFYAALAKIATAKADAMTLKFISAPEGADLFKKMAENETVTFADVLKKFKTARPGIEELVGLIPEIKPRHYSIASSQKAVGDKVELLIVTVDWIDSHGSPRFGQCTRYLAGLQPGDKVTVSIKPSVMKLPPSDLSPIIMSGLGTGAAPFRAFMQHRAWQKSQGVEVGPLIYYFGSRYRSQEYLYGEDIEAYLASGIISHAGLAFSRDGPNKVYIQHKMKEDKKLLADLLSAKKQGEEAYFFLCGPTWPVPDVYEALVESLVEVNGMEREKAEGYLEELKEDERYVLEVY